MPARQPFTALCQAAARGRATGRADLHLHTTHSDGTYTPAQVLDLARRSGLAAVAITDHDTLDGLAEARYAAVGSGVEVIAGVEISCEYRGKELHLLGYFLRANDVALGAALGWLREQRVGRFWEMVERLRACGVPVDAGQLRTHVGTGALGRRHLADFLVRTRHVGSVREAFLRYLHDGGRAVVPKARLPVAHALDRVRGAGGVAAWAHPSYDCTEANLTELRRLGLGAIEAEFPGLRSLRSRDLRDLARRAGLAVTAGSDCHGPEPAGRTVGACSATREELETLRRLANGEV